MTTTSHPTKTTDRRLATAGNIATAVMSLGLSVVCGVLLPLPVYKTLVGVAVVIAVVSIGLIVYRRFFQPQRPVVEETEIAQ